ncbi:MAG: acyltransferase [Verrucomicrobia bacterium]|nr:acyltransferase [Verrucomicrobiota bacterium]
MTVTNSSPDKFKYPSLNGLRAISILLVILYHSDHKYHILEQAFQNKLLQPFVNILRDGQLGVNVFFVISGFLITSLLLTEERKTQTVSLKYFYIRRTLRIFPAYYFYLLVLLVLHLSNIIYINNHAWWTAITYTKYFNWNLDWFTGHAWSLSIEEHFYLLYPLLFISGDKVRKTAAISFVLIVPAIKVFMYYHPVHLQWINDLTIFKRIDAIAIGCLIALYKDKLLSLLSNNFKLLFYASCLGIFLLPYLPGINQKLNLHLGFIILPFGSTIGTIANILICIILLYSVFVHQGWWFRLLNSKVLNYIGLLSYSIYLWQQLFISGKLLNYWVTSFPQNLIFVFGAALFSYYCIERPFLKLKDKFQKTKGDLPTGTLAAMRADMGTSASHH